MVCHRSMLWVTTVVGRGTKSRNKCHPSPCSGQKSMQTQNHRSWVQNFPFVCQSAVTDWVLRNRSQEQRSISASTSFGRWLLGTSKSLPVMEQSIMMNVSTSGQPGRGKEGARCGQGSCPFQGASSVNPSHSQTLLSAGHPAPSPWGSWFPQSHFSGLYFWTWLHACRTTRPGVGLSMQTTMAHP